jgi:hypothetical protein
MPNIKLKPLFKGNEVEAAEELPDGNEQHTNNTNIEVMTKVAIHDSDPRGIFFFGSFVTSLTKAIDSTPI